MKSNEKVINKDDVGQRLFTALVKTYGKDRMKSFTLDNLSKMTSHDFIHSVGIGPKGFMILNDLLVKNGYPGYKFKFVK